MHTSQFSIPTCSLKDEGHHNFIRMSRHSPLVLSKLMSEGSIGWPARLEPQIQLKSQNKFSIRICETACGERIQHHFYRTRNFHLNSDLEKTYMLAHPAAGQIRFAKGAALKGQFSVVSTENIPDVVVHRSQLIEICLFTHSNVWISIHLMWWKNWWSKWEEKDNIHPGRIWSNKWTISPYDRRRYHRDPLCLAFRSLPIQITSEDL